MTPPVVVVGAGLAGLACARRLHRGGRPVLLLERGDGVGGRVRTDVVDGFRLDRGYQVLLEAYPEAQAVLDYDRLDLCPYYPGALVRCAGGFHRLADPFRAPLDALAGAFGPVGTFADKLLVLELRNRALRGTLDELRRRPEQTVEAVLRQTGFSDGMIDRFFRPFLGGILLRHDLGTSSRMLDFVLRMMARGRTSLPAAGMQAIPAQLAEALPTEAIRPHAEVVAVRPDGVTLATGESITARAVVVAIEGDAAARLLGLPAVPQGLGVLTAYFAAPHSPVGGPVLVLNGEGPADGPVNVLSVPSDVAPAYAPPGQALVSVQVLAFEGDDAALEAALRAQLGRWYGAATVAAWRHLRTDRIAWAQPDQPPGALEPPARPVRLAEGLYVCGDHRDDASIDGALRSGRRAAETILREVAA